MDVYKEVGLSLGSVQAYDAVETIRNRTSQGTTGRLGLQQAERSSKALAESLENTLASLAATYRGLCDTSVSLVAW